MNMRPIKSKASRTKKALFVILPIILVLAGVLAYINHVHSSQKVKSGEIKIINRAKPDSSKTDSRANGHTESKSTTAGGSQTGSSGELATPYGLLVSNHRPGQNGSNLIEESQCLTNPSTKCYIKFTKDGVVKTLPEQTTDSNGSTFWQWNISDAGLTRGSWQVTAVATMGNQTKTTTDQLELEVL